MVPSPLSSKIIISPSSVLTLHAAALSPCTHAVAGVVSPPTRHDAVVHPLVHVSVKLVPNHEKIVPFPQLIAILVDVVAF